MCCLLAQKKQKQIGAQSNVNRLHHFKLYRAILIERAPRILHIELLLLIIRLVMLKLRAAIVCVHLPVIWDVRKDRLK